MDRLTGEYSVKIDSKGRLKMPKGLLVQLEDFEEGHFFINRGFEKHLILYPNEVWEKKTNEIDKKFDVYNTKKRNALRYFYRGANKISTDKTDRILIPKGLIEYAGIDKEVVLFAFQQQIEIWAKEAYEEFLNKEPEEFADILDEIFNSEDTKSG